MGDPARGEPGRTLALASRKGSADLRRFADRYTVRRAALLAVAVVAVAIGIAATAAALKGVAYPGVEGAIVGGRITAVSPTGYAWRDGIRPGQLVVELSMSDDPAGWRVVALDDGGRRIVSGGAYVEAALQSSLWLAVLALTASALAFLSVRTNRRLVIPFAWLAFITAGTPLALQGTAVVSSAAVGAAAGLPAIWVTSRIRVGALRLLVGIAFLVALAIWLLSRLDGWARYDEFDAYRSSFALLGGAALVADRLFGQRSGGGGARVIRPDVAEIVAVGALAALAVTLVVIFEAPPLAVALLVVVGAIALPTLRRRVRPMENALLADVRAQAAADGAEAERARLARDLHDVPLQELIAAIRQLEIVPGTEVVSDNLRALAGHLRNVAIDLRPPVLDDLGLPAALHELAEEATREGLSVEARLNDSATFDRGSRPPADIELAMYRIVAEAVNNSVRHAAASAIHIDGEITPDLVTLTVADNGHGLLEKASTRNSKHIGMSAMRRRAQAVDADLTIRSSSTGTEVRVEWHR